ncbi:MAG: hypothetical protein AAF651_07425 [Cyanobacteria bacterium P01_C01_bin.73]
MIQIRRGICPRLSRRFRLWLLALLAIGGAIALYGFGRMPPAIANMANPYLPGDFAGEPLGNVGSLDILQETLDIDLRPLACPDLQPTVNVTYQIQNSQAATDVNLLFVAPGLAQGEVRLDQTPVAAVKVERPEIPDRWELSETEFSPQGLQFTVPIEPGAHTIRVAYTARPSADGTGLYTRYGLDYLLSPAAQWRSFGGLSLTVAVPPRWPLESSLSLTPVEATPGEFEYWRAEFTTLPADVLRLETAPQIAVVHQVGRWALIGGGWTLALLGSSWIGRWPKRLSHRRWPKALVWSVPLLLVPLGMVWFTAIAGLGHAASLEILEAQHVSTSARSTQAYTWLILGGLSLILAAPITLLSYVLSSWRSQS